MKKEIREKVKALSIDGTDLDFINMIHLIFMTPSQKAKIINYLKLIITANINITDEDLANYIEEVLAY